MKYSQPNNSGRSIIHQFSSEGTHYIDGKRWDSVDMSFREVPTNSDKRSFMFTIRYETPSEREFKLSQFSMKEDEIKDFLDIVYETVYNPPKFKKYVAGDKFILPSMGVVEKCGTYIKKTTYENVEATIVEVFEIEGSQRYILSFDKNTVVVTEDSLNELQRI